MNLTIVIAIFNRKDELIDLLESLVNQTDKDFNIIVVDDGSDVDLQDVINRFETKLSLQYYKKPNSGPGLSRNYGVEKSNGDYILFLDSDCIAPANYISHVKENLSKNYVDAFGGADMAHKDFNNLQKAISYSMTSLFTTGGIRGKKKAITKFQPRSFNMGISKKAFNALGGFSDLRIGEDPDLSLRLWKNGFSTGFFSNVKVFHKRRSSLKDFAKQVYNFGVARPILDKRHPEYKKWVFAFPSLFTSNLIGSIKLVIFYLFLSNPGKWMLIPFLLNLLYFLIIFIDSSIKNKSIRVGLLSVLTSLVQLVGYGTGYAKSFVQINILKQDPKKAFPKHFYQ